MQNSSQEVDAPGGDPPAVKVLASASLFSSFSRSELAFLAERSEFIDLEAGQRVFEAGDPGDRLYLVESGSVVILSPEDGSVLAEFVRGDSFGELELLTEARRNAGAKAEGAARLLAFPAGGAGLKEAMSGRPEVAARILRSFLLVISGRTRKANALVKENSPWVRELQRQAYGDKLTGLLNKAYLEESLPKLIGVPGASVPLALVMMKPDNFKEINDRFGHEAGDAALVLMAGELEKAVGKEGTAVRYMGNELAVAYPGKDRAAALEAALALQARLQALDLSGIVDERDLRLSISLGIALCPEHGTEAEALIKSASALPLVGRSRGGSLVLFPEDGA
jgi:diguanylate cyclase (GGDEF)-like protein